MPLLIGDAAADLMQRDPSETHIQDLDEFTVTEAALRQMAATPDPRRKEIGDAAVRHLHVFVREVKLTPAEWLTGIAVAAPLRSAERVAHGRRVSKIWTDFEHGNRRPTGQINVSRTPFAVCRSRAT
jgi:hypothetical protein